MTQLKVNLAHERINRGCSLRGMSREIGLAPETIRRAEDGEQIGPAAMRKIAEFFGVEPKDIWPLDTMERTAC